MRTSDDIAAAAADDDDDDDDGNKTILSLSLTSEFTKLKLSKRKKSQAAENFRPPGAPAVGVTLLVSLWACHGKPVLAGLRGVLPDSVRVRVKAAGAPTSARGNPAKLSFYLK